MRNPILKVKFDYLKSLWRSLSSEKPCKTPLYDFHVKHGGKMVNFSGYSLPVSYSNHGIIASHLHTRKAASLFDVSHMLQSRVYGKNRIAFMESLTVADIEGLLPNSGTLSLFTNSNGGIIDDLIVSKTNLDYLYVVTNAGCRAKDIALLRNQETLMKKEEEFFDLEVEFLDSYGLIALQGPESQNALSSVTSVDLSTLKFMSTVIGDVAGIPNCRITRCGYTGEDGFEISFQSYRALEIAEGLLSVPSVELAGLAVRDSLRLEAGLCLYGTDIDEFTTPVESGLSWTIGRSRRNKRDFPGASIILGQLTSKKLTKQRIGVSFEGPPARNSTPIVDFLTGEFIGSVTSGCPSPSLGRNIAMGYVPKTYSKIGSKVGLKIRNKVFESSICKIPFVSTHYYV